MTNRTAAARERHRRQGNDRPSAAVLRPGLCRRGSRPDRRPDLAAAEQLSQSVARLDAAADHRLHHAVQSALDHQAGLRPDFRFRAAVRLSAQKLPAAGQRRRHRRLHLGDATHGAGRPPHPAHDHRLYDGDIEHAVRRRAGGERPAAARERRLRQSAMAVVQHCGDGGRGRRRPIGPASVAGRSAAQRRRDHCGGALGRHRRSLVSGPRAESLGQSCKA